MVAAARAHGVTLSAFGALDPQEQAVLMAYEAVVQERAGRQ